MNESTVNLHWEIPVSSKFAAKEMCVVKSSVESTLSIIASRSSAERAKLLKSRTYGVQYSIP